MPTTHIVVQGEYLSQIADAYGFRSYATIWDDPANADLKALRTNPNVLMPGDQLTIPDRTTKTHPAAANARHKFVAPAEKLTLRLIVHDESDQPVANVSCRLSVGTNNYTLTTDGTGKVEQVIPEDTREGRLVLHRDDPPLDLDLPIAVGGLDPVDTVTGQIGRLNNLGYDAGDVADLASAADPVAAQAQFESAVEEFQCNCKASLNPGLAVDGVVGDDTKAMLLQVHGC